MPRTSPYPPRSTRLISFRIMMVWHILNTKVGGGIVVKWQRLWNVSQLPVFFFFFYVSMTRWRQPVSSAVGGWRSEACSPPHGRSGRLRRLVYKLRRQKLPSSIQNNYYRGKSCVFKTECFGLCLRPMSTCCDAVLDVRLCENGN